jgi:hypothetical protein
MVQETFSRQCNPLRDCMVLSNRDRMVLTNIDGCLVGGHPRGSALHMLRRFVAASVTLDSETNRCGAIETPTHLTRMLNQRLPVRRRENSVITPFRPRCQRQHPIVPPDMWCIRTMSGDQPSLRSSIAALACDRTRRNRHREWLQRERSKTPT